MEVLRLRQGRAQLIRAAAVLLVLGLATPAGAVVGWDQAFSIERAPARVHFRARYQDQAGASHAVQVWRDGNRLRRDTDDRLAMYVEHKPGADDRFEVIDRSRAVAYKVSRLNLFRIGSFPDWTGLASMLVRPRANAEVTPAGERPEQTPAGTCRWLKPGDRRVCWSARWRLPLRIVARDSAGRWKQVLTIDQVSGERFADGIFTPRIAGLTEIDVDRDVHPDQD